MTMRESTMTSMKHPATAFMKMRVMKICTVSILSIAAEAQQIVWTRPQMMIQDFLREPHGAKESAKTP